MAPEYNTQNVYEMVSFKETCNEPIVYSEVKKDKQ